MTAIAWGSKAPRLQQKNMAVRVQKNFLRTRRLVALLLLVALFCRVVYVAEQPVRLLSGAKSELFTILTDQYPFVSYGIGRDIAYARYCAALNTIHRNAGTIRAVAREFSMPPEVIASVLLKEQFTQSAPDWFVVLAAPLRGCKGSTGLGAVTVKTARKAYSYFSRAQELPWSGEEVLELFMNNEEASIHATACVLAYEASGFSYGGTEHDLSALTKRQWHRVFNKYNGNLVYADKTIEYIPYFTQIL